MYCLVLKVTLFKSLSIRAFIDFAVSAFVTFAWSISASLIQIPVEYLYCFAAVITDYQTQV